MSLFNLGLDSDTFDGVTNDESDSDSSDDFVHSDFEQKVKYESTSEKSVEQRSVSAQETEKLSPRRDAVSSTPLGNGFYLPLLVLNSVGRVLMSPIRVFNQLSVCNE